MHRSLHELLPSRLPGTCGGAKLQVSMRRVPDILGDLFCLRKGRWASQEMRPTPSCTIRSACKGTSCSKLGNLSASPAPYMCALGVSVSVYPALSTLPSCFSVSAVPYLALHKLDCLVAGCEVIGPTQMICYKHVKITKNTKLYSHININTCLECGAIGFLYCCDVCSAAYHAESLILGQPVMGTILEVPQLCCA